MLEKAERDALAMAAYSARFADADGKVTTPIKPNQLLFARRQEDIGDDLWRTFNVIQENCIKGEITAAGFDKNNKPRMYTTREIKGIDQDVRLNRALFVLAKALADHKAS
jgi:hypothetical protein